MSIAIVDLLLKVFSALFTHQAGKGYSLFAMGAAWPPRPYKGDDALVVGLAITCILRRYVVSFLCFQIGNVRSLIMVGVT